MYGVFKRFVREEVGLEMVEWAIVGVLVLVAAGATYQRIWPWVNLNYALVLSRLALG